jgi:tetratricopeptide (TPR) repeat protein
MGVLLLAYLVSALVDQNAHLTQGTELLRHGRVQQAVDELSLAVRQEPKSYQAYFNLGLAYAQLRAPADAEPAFRKAVELAPSSADAHYNLGVALLQQQKTSQGLGELETAIKLSPTELGQDPRVLFVQARAYIAEQQWQKAWGAIDQARLGDSRNPEYLLLEARIDQKLGKPEDALPLLAKAAEVDPKSAEVPYSIAFSDYVLDKHDQVERELAVALRNDPSMDRAYFLLAVDKLTTGDFGGANSALTKALALRPRNPFYLCFRGMAVEEQNRDTSAAAVLFRDAITVAPNYALPHYHLGRILASEGKTVEAAAELETAVRLEPEMAEAWYHLARVDKSLGDASDAAAALTKFQQLRHVEETDRQEMLRSMQQGLGIHK